MFYKHFRNIIENYRLKTFYKINIFSIYYKRYMSKLPPLKLDLFSDTPAEISEEEPSPKDPSPNDNKLDHNDIFDLEDDISPIVKPVKKKKEITQKQKDHLAKIRIKAQATRKAKAEAKKTLQKPKKEKKVVEEVEEQEETDDSGTDEEEVPIFKPKKSRKKKEVDEDYINYIVGKTYDRVKADRKAKKERTKQDDTIKKQAQLDILQQQKQHYQSSPLPSQPTGKHDHLFSSFSFR